MTNARAAHEEDGIGWGRRRSIGAFEGGDLRLPNRGVVNERATDLLAEIPGDREHEDSEECQKRSKKRTSAHHAAKTASFLRGLPFERRSHRNR